MTIEFRVVPLFVRAALVALLLVAQLVAYKSFSAHQEPQQHPSQAASPTSQPTATLDQLVDQAIDESSFNGARWGVFVIALSDGRVLYSRDGNRLFTPASNMKLYTTAVALDLLGGDYRWRTSVYANSQPAADGVLQGDLILYGRGAPDLISQTAKDNTNSLSELANSLFQRGLRRITGNVIGDESFFRGEPISEGWLWNDLQWYFGAEASALSINDNEVDVSIVPPEKSGSPPVVRSSDTSGYVHLLPSIGLVKSHERFKLGIQRGLSDNEVRVWGDFPSGSKGYGAQLAVHKPALWSAHLFVQALKKQGITIDGQADSRDSRVPTSERFDPNRSNELAYATSKPLLEIERATNKHSINLNAELILRTLGRERGSMLPESPSGRERGDDEAGTQIVRLWLGRAGVPTGSLTIHDGSGLSRLNLVTPESTARLLTAMWRTNSAQAFRDTLPVSGTDGTLQGRLSRLAGRVFAKTGSLVYDTSLSGYLVTDSGENLAFSIICNDQTGTGASIRLIDEIVEILSSYPNFSKQKTGKPRDSSR